MRLVSRKALTVAGAEFAMLARTKAFVISVLLMPILAGGSIVIQQVFNKQVDATPRHFAVIDPSGAVYDELRQRTEARNLLPLRQAPFLPERIQVDDPAKLPQVRLELSDRVRHGDLFAFVEIPADVLDAKADGRIRYHSDHPTYEELRTWIDVTANDLVRSRRLRDAGLDPDLVARLDHRVPSEHMGLVALGEHGEITQAPKVDMVRTYAVPLGLMYLMWMAIFLAAPQLMNAVLQEKMSKVSEVLLGSVTPFELMMGKLLGGGAIAVLLAGFYMGGAVAVAGHWGYSGVVSPEIMAYFVVFMALAIMLYGSVFIAVGAACADLKDAQSLMMPVMIVAILPLLAWQPVLKSPASPLAVGVSLFPPATPFMMLLRLAIHPGPPLWQVALSIALTAASAVGCVWAAGRIFRVGILATGKSASFGQLLRWIRAR